MSTPDSDTTLVPFTPWPDNSILKSAPNPDKEGTWLLVGGDKQAVGVVTSAFMAELICRATHYLHLAMIEHKANMVPPVEQPRIITPN